MARPISAAVMEQVHLHASSIRRLLTVVVNPELGGELVAASDQDFELGATQTASIANCGRGAIGRADRLLSCGVVPPRRAGRVLGPEGERLG